MNGNTEVGNTTILLPSLASPQSDAGSHTTRARKKTKEKENDGQTQQ